MGTLKRLEFGLKLLRDLAQSDVVKQAHKRAVELVSERAQKIAANDKLPDLVCGAAGMLAVILAPDVQAPGTEKEIPASDVEVSAANPKNETPVTPSANEEPVSMASAGVFQDPGLQEHMAEIDALASEDAPEIADGEPQSGEQLKSIDVDSAPETAIEAASAQPVAQIIENVDSSAEAVEADPEEEEPSQQGLEVATQEMAIAAVTVAKPAAARPMGRVQATKSAPVSPKTGTSKKKYSGQAKKSGDKSPKKK